MSRVATHEVELGTGGWSTPTPPTIPIRASSDVHEHDDEDTTHKPITKPAHQDLTSDKETTPKLVSRRSSSSSQVAKSSRCRGGLMALFVGLAIVQVVVACLIVWYVGYLATKNTAAHITEQLRSSVLHDCLQTVSFEFSSTMRSSHILRAMTQKRFPDIATRLNVTNEIGWATDLTSLGALYPRVARFGIVNRYGTTVVISRPTSLTDVAITSNTGRCAMFVTNVPNYNLTTVQLDLFTTRPIRTTTNDPPFNIEGEILDDDSPSEIGAWLGPRVSRRTTYKPTGRPFWRAAETFATINQTGGWTDTYSVDPAPGEKAFLALSTFSSVLDPVTGAVQWLIFNAISAIDFTPFFASLPVGTNGRVYLIRTSGLVVATSDPVVSAIMDNTTAAINIFHATDKWLTRLLPELLKVNLIAAGASGLLNASMLVPYRSIIYEKSLSVSGASWLMQSQMIPNLPFFLVVVTKDSDFDGHLHEAIVATGWISCVVCVGAVIISILVTSCVTRPLMRVVGFMERAVGVIAMQRGDEQRTKLDRLCSDWSSTTHTANVLTTSEASWSETVTEGADQTVACQVLTCFNVGRSLHEVDLMHRSFGSMLFSLASYDELEAINQAKRAFIRYVFHEVRVPFNAIVLGIEQAQLEVKAHIRANAACSDLSFALDTMTIVHEQGEVVSRILNDVLSMQKIEDGALTLDISSFDIAKMVRVALHAFRVPCSEKRIQVDMTAVANLDLLIEAERATIPLLHVRPSIRLGSLYTADDGSVWRAHIEADPYRLRQALANLVSNAIKFSRINGKITVSVEFANFVPATPAPALRHARSSNETFARQSMEFDGTNLAAIHADVASTLHHVEAGVDGDEADHFDVDSEFNGRFLGSVSVMVRVKDTGVGLSPENTQQMFQQYAQVSANKNQAGGGTGLGLSISKSIVELHGGRIGLSSVEGEGSEFYFTIPNTRVVLIKCEGSCPADTATAHSGSRPGSRGGSMRGSSNGRIDSRRSTATNAARLLSALNINNTPAHTPLAPRERPETSMSILVTDGRTPSPMMPPLFQPSPELPSLDQSNSPDLPLVIITPNPSLPGQPIRRSSLHRHSLPAASKIAVEQLASVPAEAGERSRPTNSSGPVSASVTPAPTDAGPSAASSVAAAPSPSPPHEARGKLLPARTSSSANPLRAGARVLVVEDSVPNRKLLLAILTHMKLVSSGVENGQECVDLFPVDAATNEVDQPFDCIIMDGNMPVMNGVEACRILRARGVSVPILALTGNALAEDVASFLDSGATAVLTKPINRAQLQQALALHLPPTSGQESARRRQAQSRA